MEWMSAGSRDVDLNQRIPGDDEDLFWREEILWCLRTTQDLEKDWDSGWNVGNTVNVEKWWVGLCEIEDKKIQKW